ncbi:peptidase [Lentzea sp. NBRC 105346]|nr:peptidase [Lentzea sp. NBRC 105346]
MLITLLTALTVTAVVSPPASAGLPAGFSTQKIDWKPCFNPPPPGLPPGAEKLECGTFQTPMNWAAPGKAITIAVSRLSVGTPKKTVFTNPGGPGGAGRTLPLAFLNRPKLLQNTEIIGIDVRGTGASSNVTCGGYQALGQVDPRDRSRDNLDLLNDTYELQAKFCQRKSGELGPFVTTEQTVRDLDLLRQLLNRDKVSWIGYSGGTWMGAYYATYFPRSVDKFVLDSNAEFTSDWQTVFSAFGPGFERRFRTDYLPWVAKYDNVFHLGTTAEQVRQVYEKTRARLAEQPVTLPDGTVVTPTLLDLVLIQTQYNKLNFTQGTQFLVMLQGNQFTAQASYPDASLGTQYSILCNDTPFHGGREYLNRRFTELGKQYPLVGYYAIAGPCHFWDRPNVHLKRPTGIGVPPVLMVQSVRDPATPLEGAQRAHARFAGSRMLTVNDEGDHGIYGRANPCVNDIVESFVVDGVVPQRDLTCPGVPLPAPGAEQGGNPIGDAEAYARQVGW